MLLPTEGADCSLCLLPPILKDDGKSHPLRCLSREAEGDAAAGRRCC